jgi:copper chaperone
MKLAIEGMHCQACVARVRKALEKVEGTRVDNVDVGAAEVTIDGPREPLVLDAIRKAGYEPRKVD